MSDFTWFVVITIKRQWCLECILKFEGFAKTKGFLLRRDLHAVNTYFLKIVYAIKMMTTN